jgi:hypothetical protein
MIFILWALTDFLLAVLLVLGTSAGRIWTQVFLLVHVYYIAHTLAFQDPYLWLRMDVVARSRIFATVIVDVFIVAMLAGPKAKAYLKN